MMIKMLTEPEKVVIKAIAKNEYTNEPNEPVWTFIIEDNTNLHSKQISGIVSSLTKKELVDSNNNGKNSTIWSTKKGIKEYKQINKE